MIDPKAWLIVGVIIGKLCDGLTALLLIGAWILLRNRPLPEICGGREPQSIISDVAKIVWIHSMSLFYKKAEPAQQVITELPIQSLTNEMEPSPIKRSVVKRPILTVKPRT